MTGAAGAIGARLVGRLASWEHVERVLALDVLPIAHTSPKVVAHRHDITHPVGALLRSHGVDTVVHLAWALRPGRDREAARRTNVGGTEQVLQGCVAAGVRHVLFLSSATVYGAHAGNAGTLTEDSPLRPVRGFQYAEDKAEAEGLLARFREERPETQVTVLRACVVMGRGLRNFVTDALSKPLLLGVRGHDPPMQLLHEDDLMEATLLLLKAPRSDVYNLAGPGAVRYSDLVRAAGKRMLWLPAPLAYALVQGTWALRLQGDSPATGLDMVRWPWVVSTEKLEAATGFRPRHTSREALESSG